MFLHERLKKMKILLVDDNQDLIDTVRLGFAVKGVSLTGVSSAEEALDLVQTQSFDIIITDFKLSGINGLEFLRRIRELPCNPIKIMISAFGTEDVVKKAYDLGADDFIPKPFERTTIEDSLIRILDDSRDPEQTLVE